MQSHSKGDYSVRLQCYSQFANRIAIRIANGLTNRNGKQRGESHHATGTADPRGNSLVRSRCDSRCDSQFANDIANGLRNHPWNDFALSLLFWLFNRGVRRMLPGKVIRRPKRICEWPVVIRRPIRGARPVMRLTLREIHAFDPANDPVLDLSRI